MVFANLENMYESALTTRLLSRYDQTLFEDENKNRMMETKELFEWVLKQQCFEVSFSSPNTIMWKFPMSTFSLFPSYDTCRALFLVNS
jgi:hypothetical protein